MARVLVTGSTDGLGRAAARRLIEEGHQVERLEAEPAERRLLRMPDAGFDFALAIGIANAARQGDEMEY